MRARAHPANGVDELHCIRCKAFVPRALQCHALLRHRKTKAHRGQVSKHLVTVCGPWGLYMVASPLVHLEGLKCNFMLPSEPLFLDPCIFDHLLDLIHLIDPGLQLRRGVSQGAERSQGLTPYLRAGCPGKGCCGLLSASAKVVLKSAMSSGLKMARSDAI